MSNEGWGAPASEVNVEAAPAETAEQFNARRDKIITDWQAGYQAFKQWQEFERTCRGQVAEMLFPNPTRGTQRYALGNGYKIKLVHGLTYTLGIKDMVNPLDPTETIPVTKQVEDLQEAIRQLDNEGPLLAERLIRWKPELVDSEYRKLNSELEIEAKVKTLIDTILIVKPASPQMELEAPKAGK